PQSAAPRRIEPASHRLDEAIGRPALVRELRPDADEVDERLPRPRRGERRAERRGFDGLAVHECRKQLAHLEVHLVPPAAPGTGIVRRSANAWRSASLALWIRLRTASGVAPVASW